MAATVTFRLFPPGVRAVMRSDAVRDEMMRRAETVASRARSIAPVQSGDYKASIHAEAYLGRNRVRARVVAAVGYAQKVEARDRVLGRAIDAARSQ